MITSVIEPDLAWTLLLELRRRIRVLPAVAIPLGLGRNERGQPAVIAVADPAVLIEIVNNGEWIAKTPLTDASAELFDLYLPMALACRDQLLTVAHLGQSLDGRIATENGASRYVTGPENLSHLHRMRALCDAIVVGAGTVEHDDPQLTTRRVTGPNPVRVILDPRCRLDVGHGVFQDRVTPTLLICARELANRVVPGEVEIIGVSAPDGRLDLQEMMRRLRERGLFGIFIEGGGLTVSAFLEQGLLDRLQLTIAPLIIGSGRSGIRLPPIQDLAQGLRPRCRRYAMGEDVLFDCRLREPPLTPLDGAI